MLSNEEKQHLRAEEIFRQEVRRDIEARVQDRSRRAKFWHALNTPFVLWVLSSILVGSFGWAFSTIQASHEEKTRNLESVRKLDTEIANRIQEALKWVAQLEADALKKGMWVQDEAKIFSFLLEPLDRNPKLGRDSGIYPEFRERTFPQLIAELQRLIPPGERADVTKSLIAYRVAQARADEGSGSRVGGDNQSTDERNAAMLKTAKEASELFKNQIKLDRWKALDE